MTQLVLALIVGAIAAGAALLAFRPERKSADAKRIPPALRPSDVDAVLESDRLNRIHAWGLVLTVFFAFFLPFYWLYEPENRRRNEEKFAEESLERGERYYAMQTDPVTGESNLSGKECARCHGVDAGGGTNEFLNPNTGETSIVQVPELKTVFARYDTPPPGFDDARAYIRETIERGRPGTDMPTWGAEFGGPLTEQEIDDIVDWLESIQVELDISAEASGQEIFTQLCAACHGAAGAGGSAPAMQGGSELDMFPDVADHEAFVRSGSAPGVPYGTSGTGTGAMPAWGTLTDEQISAVVEYERSL